MAQTKAHLDMIDGGTTKGDLIVFDGTKWVRVGVGTNGQGVIADSAQSAGVKWGTVSGGGLRNLITNGDADGAAASIFVPYADAAATRPVDGTGGSPTVTTSLTTTNPLDGTTSFLLTKPASNVQGQGWSIDFDVPIAYRGKSLKNFIQYIVNSGTFVAGSNSTDGDLIVTFYDRTNSKIVEPSNIKLFASSTTNSDVQEGSIQLDASCAQARIIFHIASTSTSAWVLKVDGVAINPGVAVYAAPVSDEVAYTPIVTNGTNVALTKAVGCRRGDKFYGRLFYTLTGSGSGGVVAFSLPSGLVMDTSKINASGVTAVGSGNWQDSGTANKPILVMYSSTTTVYLQDAAIGSISGTALAINDTLAFDFEVPIVGWSSSVRMGDPGDARPVSFSGQVTNGAITAAVTNFPATVIKDSHGAWNGTQFIVPVAGDYTVALAAYTASGGFSGSVYVNGTVNAWLGSSSAANLLCSGSQLIPNLKVGDIISIRSSGSFTLANDASQRITIFKTENLQGIAANDLILAKYTLAAATALTSAAIINFPTKVFDTHSAVTTGASWKFTAPAAGYYTITVLQNGNSAHNYRLYKNNSADDYITGAAAANYLVNGSTTQYLLAGDYIDVRPDANTTTQSTTYISVKRE